MTVDFAGFFRTPLRHAPLPPGALSLAAFFFAKASKASFSNSSNDLEGLADLSLLAFTDFGKSSASLASLARGKSVEEPELVFWSAPMPLMVLLVHDFSVCPHHSHHSLKESSLLLGAGHLCNLRVHIFCRRSWRCLLISEFYAGASQLDQLGQTVNSRNFSQVGGSDQLHKPSSRSPHPSLKGSLGIGLAWPQSRSAFHLEGGGGDIVPLVDLSQGRLRFPIFHVQVQNQSHDPKLAFSPSMI